LKILSLEKKGRNKIWTRILKNSFAPLLIGKFDFVVGNPPWINWENLPEFYREETKGLWEWYGLTKILGRGAFKRDMAMLFVARCLDRFTKENGRLAFLIPFTVYKTQAGAGFREFLAKEKTNFPCKVLKIHDLVTLYPFERAVNRTSLVVIEKSGKTEFPIPCVMWHNPRSKGINQEAELEEVRKVTRQFSLVFIPVDRNKPETPWMEITGKAYHGLRKVRGSSPWYEAHNGVYTALNQVYWVNIISKEADGLLITNPPLSGQKKKVKQIKRVVEKDLIYPLIRGRDVKKWYIVGEYGWIIIPHDPKTGKPIPENVIKVKYPRIFSYFKEFQKELEKRTIKPFLGNRPKTHFYRLDNIGSYTFYPYKVIWKPIAGAITGKAISFASAVLSPLDEGIVIPDHSLMFVGLQTKDEAYYLSSILNSSIILLAIASYSYEIGAYAHITQYLNIPKFNPKNPLHQKLSQLSQKAHETAKKIYEENREDLEEDLKKIEEEIDKTVAELYGITDDELKEIRKCLMILKEGEIPEEEEENEMSVSDLFCSDDCTDDERIFPFRKDSSMI